MTIDRYEALLAKAGEVTFEIIRGGKHHRVRSYLPELLVLANETGRRLSAILGLTYEDLDLERRPTAPHGSITWRADLDKKGVEWPDVPITVAARVALDGVLRERPGIGKAPLFPAPEAPYAARGSTSRRQVAPAERLAGLQPQAGGLWHPFRRKAANRAQGPERQGRDGAPRLDRPPEP